MRAWTIRFGMFLTVAARSSYPVGPDGGRIRGLVAFNELQHKLYGFVQHFEAGTDWGIEALVDSIYQVALSYGVEGDFKAAIGWSLAPGTRSASEE